MIINAARCLSNDMACFVGIGLPSTAANLARRLHAPDCVLVYESGCIGAKPTRLPLSIGDGELAETADAVVSRARDLRLLAAGRAGSTSGSSAPRRSTASATSTRPSSAPTSTRGRGCRARAVRRRSPRRRARSSCIIRQTARAFVERCDFRTSVGFGDGPGDRERLGPAGAGPTDGHHRPRASSRPDPATCELVLTELHQGVHRRAGHRRHGVAAEGGRRARPSPRRRRRERAGGARAALQAA